MLKKLKIKSKLILLSTVFSLMLMLCAFFGYAGMNKVFSQLSLSYSHGLKPFLQSGNIKMDLIEIKSNLYSVLMQSLVNPENSNSNYKQIEKRIEEVDALWNTYKNFLHKDDKELADNFVKNWNSLKKQSLEAILTDLKNKEYKKAYALLKDKVNPALNKTLNSVEKLRIMQEEDAKLVNEVGYKSYRNAVLVILLVVLIGIFLGIIIAFATIKTVIGPIKDFIYNFEKGSQGDLSVSVKILSQDEIGIMGKYFNEFFKNLAEIVSDILASNEHVLSATAEVSAGNQDLSSRVDSQSSALEETASSVEEMAANLKSMADNSKEALSAIEESKREANSGKDTITEAVVAIQEVTAQAGKINEIVKIIDGIAFQTNILALNAAVEAARAKDHGKGFAVVANEVRSLAQKSAENAKQIEAMISKINKGIKLGNDLVEKSKNKFDDIQQKVIKATDLVNHLAASASEQSDGIEQISDAVAQLEQITQNNASLVEEVAGAAEELETQAQDVVQSLSFFDQKAIKRKKKTSSSMASDEDSDLLIRWDNKYSVHVSEFDSHHQKLLDIINDLYKGLKQNKGIEQITETIQELVDYTEFHFSKEEETMKSYQYPGLPEQIDQHKKFVQAIKDAGEDIKSGKSLSTATNLLTFLKNWLINHIMKIDIKYSDFLNERGVK